MMSRMHENKERITITLDAELLRRIDVVCADRHEPRSSYIERLLKDSMKEVESFRQDLENPVFRGIAKALVSTPGVLTAIAKLAGNELSSEELAEIRKDMPRMIEQGRERQSTKKPRSRKGPALEGA